MEPGILLAINHVSWTAISAPNIAPLRTLRAALGLRPALFGATSGATNETAPISSPATSAFNVISSETAAQPRAKATALQPHMAPTPGLRLYPPRPYRTTIFRHSADVAVYDLGTLSAGEDPNRGIQVLVAIDSHAEREGHLARVRAITGGRPDFREPWLRAAGLRVLAEESAEHFDEDQCQRLSQAYRSAGVEELIGVANEELIDEPLVIRLGADFDSLCDFSDRFRFYAYLLLPPVQSSPTVLCSKSDYLLFAGSVEFLSAYAGDLAAARLAYVGFVEGEGDPEWRRIRSSVLHHMDWIDTGQA